MNITERQKEIYVTRSSMPPLEEYVEEIKPIFDTHMLTNFGPIYKKFQHQLEEFLGVEEISLFANGHMALEMAIRAMGLEGEIITTPYTFSSTTHAIVRNNITPVFCDIKADDYTIDPSKIEPLITKRTTAILPVHVYGSMCDVDAIREIADKHHLKVLYDAAHAFGAKYKGRCAADFGDMSVLSFHATKVFNTIEGGAVVYHDSRYRDALHELKNFGIHNAEDVVAVGGNAKMDEFRAAMGICNLRHVNEDIKKRKAIFERYNEHLEGIKGLKIMKNMPDIISNYAYYPVYVSDEYGKSRDQIFDELAKMGIHIRKYFYPAVNDYMCYKKLYGNQITPIAHDVAGHIITLPIYQGLEMDVVDRIAALILK